MSEEKHLKLIELYRQKGDKQGQLKAMQSLKAFRDSVSVDVDSDLSGLSDKAKSELSPQQQQQLKQARDRQISALYGHDPALAEHLKNTPASSAVFDFAKGIPGALPTIASSIVAEPVAGISGLAVEAINQGKKITGLGEFKQGAGAEVVDSTRDALTLNPIGEAAKETLASVGKAFEPISGAIESVGGAALEKTGSPAIATATETALIAIPEILGARFGAKGGKAAYDSMKESSLSSLMKANNGIKSDNLSIGSAQTPKDIQRAAMAQSFPVPFEGDSALTQGQVTRNFEQLQFEKESAKLAEIGEPLRNRMENQTATIIQNFDALSDMPNPLQTELRDIGQQVDKALIARKNRLKKIEAALYREAENAGQMSEKVSLDAMADIWEDLTIMEDVAANAAAIRRIAKKRGLIDEVEGSIQVNSASLSEIESFRQVVNHVTDITDPRESRVRRIVLSAIDDATENAGGDVYQKARKFSGRMRQEFENTGLTKRLLSTKKNTSERSIAYEDAFKKIILDSPVEEINKLRGSLLKAGPDGKQAWANLKSRGIDYIVETSQSFSQLDAKGQPTLSPDKLNRVIKSLDDQGKLEKIYGRRNAQVIRDLGEIAKDIYTAPPGAVNHSNTASALQVALDSLGTFAVTGIPAPAATALRESAKYVKSAKRRKKIQESLDYLNKPGIRNN